MDKMTNEISLVVFGTTAGLNYRSNKYMEQMGLKEKIKSLLATLPREYCEIVPNRDYWIVLSEKNSEGNTITLYGRYRYAEEIEESRNGGYYGGAVIVKDATLTSFKVVSYLDTLVKEIEDGLLNRNNKFIKDFESLPPFFEISAELDLLFPMQIEKKLIEYQVSDFDKSNSTDFIEIANEIIYCVNAPKIVIIASYGEGVVKFARKIPSQTILGLHNTAMAFIEEGKKKQKNENHKKIAIGKPSPPRQLDDDPMPKNAKELERFILKVIKENFDTTQENIFNKKTQIQPSQEQEIYTQNENETNHGQSEFNWDDTNTYIPQLIKNTKKWGKIAAILVVLIGLGYFSYPYLSFDFLKTERANNQIQSARTIPEQNAKIEPKEEPVTIPTCTCFGNSQDIRVQYYVKVNKLNASDLYKKLNNVCPNCTAECEQVFVEHIKAKNQKDAPNGLLKKDGFIDMFFKRTCTTLSKGMIFEDDRNGGLKEYVPPPKVKPKEEKAKPPKVVSPPSEKKWDGVDNTKNLPTNTQAEKPANQ